MKEERENESVHEQNTLGFEFYILILVEIDTPHDILSHVKLCPPMWGNERGAT